MELINIAKALWNAIKNENQKKMNTATRVGNAGMAILDAVKNNYDNIVNLQKNKANHVVLLSITTEPTGVKLGDKYYDNEMKCLCVATQMTPGGPLWDMQQPETGIIYSCNGKYYYWNGNEMLPHGTIAPNIAVESITRPPRTDRNIIFEGNSRTADWKSRQLKPGVTFVMNGNSYSETDGVQSTFANRGFYSYAYYLMQQPNFKDRFNYYNVAMWGVSNTYSWWAGILTDKKYFDDIYPRRPETHGGEAGIKEAWLFIETGIYDTWGSNPTSVVSIINTYRNYLLRAKSHGFKVVVLGEYFGYSTNYRVPNDLVSGKCNYTSGTNDAELARQKYNNACMEMAAKGEIDMYIDLDHLFTPNLDEANKDQYHYDTIAHLTGAGHQLIAEYINSLFSVSGNLYKVAYNRFINLPAMFNKVDKVAGKGLSTCDFTWQEKYKVAEIDNKINKIPALGAYYVDGYVCAVATWDESGYGNEDDVTLLLMYNTIIYDFNTDTFNNISIPTGWRIPTMNDVMLLVQANTFDFAKGDNVWFWGDGTYQGLQRVFSVDEYNNIQEGYESKTESFYVLFVKQISLPRYNWNIYRPVYQNLTSLAEYANNAAAISGGLTQGQFYHTAGVVKVVI